MIVTYLRSSSLGTYSMCQTQYFINYVLGVKNKDNGKALMGSVMHKNLELLAKRKLADQNGEVYVDDDNFGKMRPSKFKSLEKLNKMSLDFYEQSYPGIMPAKAEQITLEWTKLALTRYDGEMDPRNQVIFAVEDFFEIEVKEPWAAYDYKIGDKVISGQLGIKGTVDLIVLDEDGWFHIIDYKGLPIETKIPTPCGWSTMGDLKVGDVVFDQYGKQTNVIGKSQQNTKDCYEITFDDTSRVVCDDEHYWKLSDGTKVQIKELKIGDTINVSKPIDCDKKDLPIDPYVLGIWLGDGRNRGGEISSGDKFIFDEIERRGYFVGKDISPDKPNCEARTIYNLTSQLRKSNLLHNKHIPEIYFRSSYNQRLDLLRGMMDSDGSANCTRKQCVFMNCRKELSEDVKRLLLTLGQRALVSNTIANGFGLTVKAYPVSFRPVGINPFLLPVKADKVIGWGPGRSDKRIVRKIEVVEPRVTQCIAVDSVDNTFLCTENMIPTHNSGRRYNWATGKIKTYESLQNDKQLLLYYYALRNKYPDKKFRVSIYYVNDHVIDKVMTEGGVFTFVFDDDDYKLAESMIKKEFETIKNNNSPKPISSDLQNWKCKYLCAYSQIIPSISTSLPACTHLSNEIRDSGIDFVTEKYGDISKMTQYTGGGKINVELKND